jgi:hypothetical protein
MVHTLFPPNPFRTMPSRAIGTGLTGLILAAMLALGGCASVPPPDAAMSLAQNRLQSARDAGAADYAPVDLGFAQNKFQLAQDAMASHKYEDAANLAEESRSDAELARGKARLGAARAQIQSKIEENNHLREQMEQAHPDAPSQPAAPAGAPAPPSAPAGDMPAPSASVLSAPMPAQSTQGDGFQSVPQSPSQGGQP